MTHTVASVIIVDIVFLICMLSHCAFYLLHCESKKQFTTEPVSEKTLQSVNICWSYGQEFGVLFFLTHNVYIDLQMHAREPENASL